MIVLHNVGRQPEIDNLMAFWPLTITYSGQVVERAYFISLTWPLCFAGGNVADAIDREDIDIAWQRKGHHVALDVARAITFLHSHQVYHGDDRVECL